MMTIQLTLHPPGTLPTKHVGPTEITKQLPLYPRGLPPANHFMPTERFR